MVNTPIPHSLKSEAKKAAKILREFTVPTTKVGPDKLIPAGILLKAKGLAIITVVKAGFLVTARGGSGIVIAKIEDGLDSEWSAPSAIGIAGLGGGFEIGAEVTDFVIILNSRAALDAFSKGGNLTLGGNFSIAAGPLGRNVEADVAVRSPAAIYTYSKTRGLFAGISVEGSILIERKDANRKFYGDDIRAYHILSGEISQPTECAQLYEVLEMHKNRAVKELERIALKTAHKGIRSYTGDETMDKAEKYSRMLREKVKKEQKSEFPSSIKERRKTVHNPSDWTLTNDPFKSSLETSKYASHEFLSVHKGEDLCSPVTAVAVAKFPFTAQLVCDLTFDLGEEIKVLTRTSSTFDWWEGSCRGKRGLFPANYVALVP